MQAASRAALCDLVEDDLTSLIREAATVQRHSRRARFRPMPTSAAMAAAGRRVDPNTPAAAAALSRRSGAGAASGAAGKGGGGALAAAAAAGGGGPKRRRLLHADDVNLALCYRGSDRLYLTNAGQLGPPTVTIGRDDDQGNSGRGSGGNPAAAAAAAAAPSSSAKSKRKERETAVDLNSYLRTEMALRPPSEVGLRSHWLAVDGVQPDIPENPPPLGGDGGIDGWGGGAGAAAGGSSVGTARGVGAGIASRRDLTVHRVEDEEDLEAVAASDGGGGGPDDDGSPGASGAASSSALGGGVSVRQLLPRLLSEELRLYFTRITLAVERGGPDQVDAALRAVGRDSGIQELVPFFVRFVSRQIYANVGRVEYCRTLVRLAGRLVANPNLHLELNLHQLLPPLITCVVARRLAVGGGGDGDGGNHWALREEAAGVLMAACSM